MTGILSIRKTLVLGLGSTGLRVAEQLAEHLNWKYGSFEAASWVRLLVLETAQPASPLGDRVLWGGLTREEYLPYLNSPRTTGAEFGFAEWQDGPTLRDINNPADGAGNCRMLGRLCIYHPRTYDSLRRRVTEELAALERLTPQQVADALGQPGLTVRMHEGGTVLYAVGTLCGGTCSGGAADLGYLVGVWGKDRVRRQAIFTIPNPGLSHALGRRYKKNAYYALKELNHYQLEDTAWVQRLPEFLDPERRRERPYDILRVLMPGGPSGEDVERLNAMISQYLAAAVGPAGFEIAASDVDAFGKMEGSESIGFMRPLFSTMGVAALEYPGEHIQRGATSRLTATALERWCAYTEDAERFQSALRGFPAGDLDGLLQRLQQEADRLFIRPVRELLQGVGREEPPRVEEVRQAIRDVETRFAVQEALDRADASAPPVLDQIVGQVADGLVQGATAEIGRLLESRLLDLDAGPGFVAALLRRALGEMETWETTMHALLAAARQDSDSLREILNHRLDEADRAGRGWAWGRRDRLRRKYEALAGDLQAYLAGEARAHIIQHLQRRGLSGALTEQYRRESATLLRRLDAVRAAFSQEAAALQDAWKAMAASSPSVNGKAYYDAEPPAARGTLTEEYYLLIRQRRWPDEPATGWDEAAKELAAQRDLIAALAPLQEELCREDGYSAFDPRPGLRTARESIPRTLLAALEERASRFFTPLRAQTHIADKAADSDIDTVVQVSEPRLAVSAAQVSEQLAGVRGSTPMLSYLAFMDLRGEGGERPSVARVEQRVRNAIELRRGGLIDSDDPFRLLIIREKHGFTLGQMEGVVRRDRYDNQALQSAEGDTDFKYWHTRRDVDWIDPLTPPGHVEATQESWLLVLLLGRPADPGLPWLPASAGEIPPEGWYQLVNGEFCVFHAPGSESPEPTSRLPLSFPAAVARLMTADYALLRRTLAMRFSTYCDSQGHDHVIRTVQQGLQSLAVFGADDLDVRAADRIVRRAYRRSDGLTRSFFAFRTEELRNPAEFAHLRRLQGTPIEGRPGEVYPSDGYYCPECSAWLGGTIEKLLEDQFLCARCSTGKRYWP